MRRSGEAKEEARRGNPGNKATSPGNGNGTEKEKESTIVKP